MMKLQKASISQRIVIQISERPELRFTPSGKPLLQFPAITGPNSTNIYCLAWGGLAEEMANNDYQIGDILTLAGRFKARKWEDRDGNTHSREEFTIRELISE